MCFSPWQFFFSSKTSFFQYTFKKLCVCVCVPRFGKFKLYNFKYLKVTSNYKFLRDENQLNLELMNEVRE